MTIPEGSYLPPQLNYSQRSRNVVPIILGVFFCIVVCLGVGIFALVKSTSHTTAAAEQGARRFLTMLQQQKYESAKELMTPAAQQATTVSSIKALVDECEKDHGKLLTWGTPSWYVQDFNGIVYVRLEYPLTYSKGSSGAEIVMQRLPSGGFAVYNFNLQL